MRSSSTARSGSCAWPKGFGHGYPRSERPVGPTACSSCRRAQLRGPARKPVTNSSRRSRPNGEGARAGGPRCPARATLRRLRRARELVLRLLPRRLRADRAQRWADPSGGGRPRRPSPRRGTPAEVRWRAWSGRGPRRAGRARARPRSRARRDDRRDRSRAAPPFARDGARLRPGGLARSGRRHSHRATSSALVASDPRRPPADGARSSGARSEHPRSVRGRVRLPPWAARGRHRRCGDDGRDSWPDRRVQLVVVVSRRQRRHRRAPSILRCGRAGRAPGTPDRAASRHR